MCNILFPVLFEQRRQSYDTLADDEYESDYSSEKDQLDEFSSVNLFQASGVWSDILGYGQADGTPSESLTPCKV